MGAVSFLLMCPWLVVQGGALYAGQFTARWSLLRGSLVISGRWGDRGPDSIPEKGDAPSGC